MNNKWESIGFIKTTNWTQIEESSMPKGTRDVEVDKKKKYTLGLERLLLESGRCMLLAEFIKIMNPGILFTHRMKEYTYVRQAFRGIIKKDKFKVVNINGNCYIVRK